VDGTLYYVHQDHPSTSSGHSPDSTVAVSDAAGGAVGRVLYDPYGEILTSTLPVTLTDRLFTGQRLDSSTGLYYYNARYYDPHLGRFIQPDTLVPDPLNPQAWNRFGYCYNNPTSYVDPNGQFAVPAILLVAAVGCLVGEIYAGTQGYTPLDAEFWYYSGGWAVAATGIYFLTADVAIVAGLGLQQAGLWTGSTTAFGLGLTFTSAGAGMYAWAFQPLDFSPRLRLYHATSTAGAENIRRIGIDLSYGRTEADFGQGFYMTRNRAQAQEWAERAAKKFGGEPAILEFRVSLSELESLKGLRFARPTEAWQAFVTAYRTTGTPMHSYDFVEGPVAVSIAGVWVPHPDPAYHQLSIHTQRAVDIFWRRLVQ
jgi:RHS repeat-associated protein